MKKTITLFLIFMLTLCLMGCETTENSSSVYCFNCGESTLPENSQFCLACGSNMLSTVDYDNLTVDYSDFGFENTYGMNEWMEIRSYNFEDKDNPYVLVSQSLKIIVLENNIGENYYLERYFSSSLFRGNSSIGELFETLKYNIVSNNLIEFQTTNYPTWEINVIIDSGIPIIYEAEKSHYDEPELIPTQFIDWSRELEGVIITKDDGSQAFYNKYYLKSECIR